MTWHESHYVEGVRMPCDCGSGKGAVKATLKYTLGVVGLGIVCLAIGLLTNNPPKVDTAPPTPAQRCDMTVAQTTAMWTAYQFDYADGTLWCYVPSAGTWLQAP